MGMLEMAVFLSTHIHRDSNLVSALIEPGYKSRSKFLTSFSPWENYFRVSWVFSLRLTMTRGTWMKKMLFLPSRNVQHLKSRSLLCG